MYVTQKATLQNTCAVLDMRLLLVTLIGLPLVRNEVPCPRAMCGFWNVKDPVWGVKFLIVTARCQRILLVTHDGLKVMDVLPMFVILTETTTKTSSHFHNLAQPSLYTRHVSAILS